MSTYKSLTLHVQDEVATVTLDYGELNVLDAVLVMDLIEVVETIKQDADIKVAIFESANPDYFASHADFTLLQQLRGQPANTTDELPLYSKLLETIRTMPKVSIAKIAGRARGGGAELALSMDMIFGAIDQASLSQMEIVMGIAPGGGGGLYLARRVGRARAMEICLGGGDYTAVEAERYGYINRALPADELDDFVAELARRIASFDSASIAANKAIINLFEDRFVDDFSSNSRYTGELIASENFDTRVERFLATGGSTGAGELAPWQSWAAKLANAK